MESRLHHEQVCAGECCALRTAQLPYNSFDNKAWLQDGDVALLAQGIRGLPNVEKLDLSGNATLTPRAARALSQLVDTRPQARARPPHVLSGAGASALRELHLDDVPLADEGSAALFAALVNNDTLHVVSCCGCSIGHRAADTLQHVLFQNSTMHSLLLSNNRYSTSCKRIVPYNMCCILSSAWALCSTSYHDSCMFVVQLHPWLVYFGLFLSAFVSACLISVMSISLDGHASSRTAIDVNVRHKCARPCAG
jgi:hypothetical protein